jgi:hypothetical protein
MSPAQRPVKPHFAPFRICEGPLNSEDLKSAVDLDDLTRDGVGTAGSQERGQGGDIVGSSSASDRYACLDVRGEIFAHRDASVLGRGGQGLLARNVAENVSRVAQSHRDVDTYTEAEVKALLATVEEDRLGHAWELALSGLRREEIAGLRWADVDIEANTPSIVNNRVMAAGRSVENDPESMASRRTLPLPDRLVSGLAISQGASISVATGAWRGSFRLRGE